MLPVTHELSVPVVMPSFCGGDEHKNKGDAPNQDLTNSLTISWLRIL